MRFLYRSLSFIPFPQPRQPASTSLATDISERIASLESGYPHFPKSITIYDYTTFMDSPSGGIVAFWHGKMMLGWVLSLNLARRLGFTSPRAVVSKSKDGELLSRTLSSLGFMLIRGSSSKGKEEVKRDMISTLSDSGCIVITPDGPRGPRGVWKYGTLRIASERQLPIYFLRISFSASYPLSSWDLFEIPLPFTVAEVDIVKILPPKFEHDTELADYSQWLSALLR